MEEMRDRLTDSGQNLKKKGDEMGTVCVGWKAKKGFPGNFTLFTLVW